MANPAPRTTSTYLWTSAASMSRPSSRRSRGDYYVSEPAIRAAVKSGYHFNVIHMNAAVKVDLFLAGDDAFDLERLDARQALQLPTEPETQRVRGYGRAFRAAQARVVSPRRRGVGAPVARRRGNPEDTGLPPRPTQARHVGAPARRGGSAGQSISGGCRDRVSAYRQDQTQDAPPGLDRPSGAPHLLAWAWVDSNYRPHAYQALSMVSTGVSGRQEWLNHAISASAAPVGVTRTKAVCVTACVTTRARIAWSLTRGTHIYTLMCIHAQRVIPWPEPTSTSTRPCSRA